MPFALELLRIGQLPALPQNAVLRFQVLGIGACRFGRAGPGVGLAAAEPGVAPDPPHLKPRHESFEVALLFVAEIVRHRFVFHSLAVSLCSIIAAGTKPAPCHSINFRAKRDGTAFPIGINRLLTKATRRKHKAGTQAPGTSAHMHIVCALPDSGAALPYRAANSMIDSTATTQANASDTVCQKRTGSRSINGTDAGR